MTDWLDLTARAGAAAHDLVGWIMWDPSAIAAYERLGVQNDAFAARIDATAGPRWMPAVRSRSIADLT